jgi:hypothetical protein
VLAGTPTCGPFGENAVYTTASGQTVNGTREPFGPAFGSVSYQTSIGNSNYNAFEVSLHRTSSRLELFAGYTYSKSIDQASNLGDQIDPFDAEFTRGLSSFDMRHNFVLSYSYRVPVERLLRSDNRWTRGWTISGITRFSTGFPVTFYNFDDTSLLGTQSNGINNLPIDGAEYLGGSLDIDHNPRDGQPYFNTAAFGLPPLGSPGNIPRRFFSGPGINNFDMTLQKSVQLTESKSWVIRVEAFNTFNHAQFYGPTAVDGNVDSATFGQIVSAAAPRLIQIATKISF